MKAIILAAGYATRLYPLTQNKPKCLLEVGGVTLLDHLLKKVEILPGLTDILIVTNAKFYRQFLEWQKTAKLKIPLKILNDGSHSNEDRLGAVGDLGFAIRREKIQDDILMMASDNLFDQDLAEFIGFSRRKPGSVCVSVYELGDPALAAGKFGVLALDPQGRVNGMEEKPERPNSSLIGVGVYFFPSGCLQWVEEYLSRPGAKDAPGYFIRWIYEKGAEIFGFQFKGMWYDVGDLKALEEANLIFNKGV